MLEVEKIDQSKNIFSKNILRFCAVKLVFILCQSKACKDACEAIKLLTPSLFPPLCSFPENENKLKLVFFCDSSIF